MAQATAQGPQRLVEYLGPALRWCGLEPAGMASLLSSRKPLRANVASVVHVAAGGGADEQEHALHTNAAVRATLNRLVPYFERPNRALAARLDRLHLPKESSGGSLFRNREFGKSPTDPATARIHHNTTNTVQ